MTSRRKFGWGRNQRLQVVVTMEELELIMDAAELQRVSASCFARRLLLPEAQRVVAKGEQAAAPTSEYDDAVFGIATGGNRMIAQLHMAASNTDGQVADEYQKLAADLRMIMARAKDLDKAVQEGGDE